MGFLEDKFLDKENFYLAFKRLRAHYSQSNEWYDPIELFSFEANLATNIYNLIERVKSKDFETHEMYPIPFPKTSTNGENTVRPFYKVHIEFIQMCWFLSI